MKIVGLLGALFVIAFGISFWKVPREQVSEAEKKAVRRNSSSTAALGSAFSKLPNSKKEKIPEKLFVAEGEVDKSSSQLIASLNRPETDAKDDVRILKKVFSHYRSAFKYNPTGIHQEILHQFTGGNKQGVAYIPKDHPALVNGQLHDRWGTPFYFHQISSDIMEIRSAGPDKQHWNADDITTQ